MGTSKSSNTSEPQEPFAPGTLVHRLLLAVANAINDRLKQAHDSRDLKRSCRSPQKKGDD